ncbi:hypothetical protein E6B08_27930 [Pseudomonas putida]|uniref:Uncharacterized protein n=1 Tax=Pseudomonas putida TaxID=303 RepID=A0A4D6XGH8_PSEPU|nr:hypothetical protein [Pseudomonas putida]QCI14949.1 hypothetical protein E6B08_27930 [Pseudomonas putida]
MRYKEQSERFDHVRQQSLQPSQVLHTDSGLSICANSTAGAGLHEAFRGEDGTELVIGENCDVEIAFDQEVEQLRLELYVVSDRHGELQDLTEAERLDRDQPLEPLSYFYWITLSGSGYTEFLPGPISSQPCSHLLLGPFRRLTFSTSQAGTVHIRQLQWTPTCRH